MCIVQQRGYVWVSRLNNMQFNKYSYVLYTFCQIWLYPIHYTIMVRYVRELGFRWFMVCILFLKVLRVADSITSLGSLFHVLMVLGKKEFRWQSVFDWGTWKARLWWSLLFRVKGVRKFSGGTSTRLCVIL